MTHFTSCNRWENHTNFFASKKLLRCRICHVPMPTRIISWARDHQNTRLLVLSDVCLNLSSRYWKYKEIRSTILREGGATITWLSYYKYIFMFLFCFSAYKSFRINERIRSNSRKIIIICEWLTWLPCNDKRK